jgi:hypothetical protein
LCSQRDKDAGTKSKTQKLQANKMFQLSSHELLRNAGISSLRSIPE